MNFKSISDLNRDINCNLSLLKSENFDIIVGIPRSGMLPASIISLKLNLPLITLTEYLNNSTISHGRTRKPSNNIKYAHDANKVLIVDDSIHSGGTLSEVKREMDDHLLHKARFLAVYGISNDKSADFILEIVKPPRFFEWNAMHHNIISDSCFDIDGVLCEDPREDQNDDGPKYIEFLENAKPLYLPIKKIDTIVTNRLEKYRPQTIAWLEKHGIEYNNLKMVKLETKEERISQTDYFKHKVDVYLQSNTKIFYESSLSQAKVIFERTKMPVYCVDENILFSTDSAINYINKPQLKWILKERFYRYNITRKARSLIKRLLKKSTRLVLRN
ncbi:phosphoribosyltransferase family protein [Vibrio parahaemolyticus]